MNLDIVGLSLSLLDLDFRLFCIVIMKFWIMKDWSLMKWMILGRNLWKVKNLWKIMIVWRKVVIVWFWMLVECGLKFSYVFWIDFLIYCLGMIKSVKSFGICVFKNIFLIVIDLVFLLFCIFIKVVGDWKDLLKC